MEPTRTSRIGAQPAVPAPEPKDGEGTLALPPRRSLRPSGAEWVLLAYMAVVSVVTVLGYTLGPVLVRTLASTADQVAVAHLWPLFSSGLLADGPLVPQVAGTIVLGVLAIRLAGGRAFWIAAVMGHVVGTLLVYAGVWIADLQDPSAVAALSSEADFGISLVWCAALGVLAAVAWWHVRPLRRLSWLAAAVVAPAALLVVAASSGGLARYEHVAAFAVAAGLVYVARRWASFGRWLRLGGAAR